MVPSSSDTLLGRGPELGAVLLGLKRSASGQGACFALVGEPGIGKTRLASELSEHAAQLGHSVHWGRAWEAGGAPSYWPWRQLLESIRPSLGLSRPDAPLSTLWGTSSS